MAFGSNTSEYKICELLFGKSIRMADETVIEFVLSISVDGVKELNLRRKGKEDIFTSKFKNKILIGKIPDFSLSLSLSAAWRPHLLAVFSIRY